MIRNAPLYALIPARAGSKGIPGKNLLEVGGMSLLERAVRLGQGANRVDAVWVSTDDLAMHRIAGTMGAAMKTLRPERLATDTALSIDVIIHAAAEMDIPPESHVLLLQTTSPLRASTDMEDVLDLYEREPSCHSVVSVTPHAEPHPYKLQKIEDGRLSSFLGVEPGVPRQQLPPVYRLNGAFYLSSLRHLREHLSFFGPHVAPYVMPEERSLNLDGPMDLLLLRALLDKPNPHSIL